MNRKRTYEGDYPAPKRYHRYSKYQEKDEFEDSLLSLIAKLGDEGDSLIRHLHGLAGIIERDFSQCLGSSVPDAVAIICDCVAEIPDKTSIYSTLVALLNKKNDSCGAIIVEALIKNFKAFLKAGEWEKCRTYIRFFADLVSCHVISAGSLISLFEKLVDVTMEDNIPQARSDFFVYMVLSALPWVGLELHEKKEEDFEQLLNTINDYLNRRQKSHHTALRVWYSDTPHPQEEYLDCLWTQITKLRKEQKWVEKYIYRPYLHVGDLLCDPTQHDLPPIIIPPHESTCIYPYPKVIFRLFDYTDCAEEPTLPGAHSIERFLVEESVRWVIDSNYLDKKKCAIALSNMRMNHELPMEYIIVEVILSELFALPTSKYIEACYVTVLLCLCKNKADTVPRTLVQAIDLLFDRLDTMNVSCVHRFVSWFSFTLNNFSFRWNWGDWDSSLSLNPLHPKPMFISETLLHCMRFSYHGRVAASVLSTLEPLLPPVPKPHNKFKTDDGSILPGTDIAKKLSQMVVNKASSDEILATLDELSSITEENENLNLHSVKIDIFFSVILVVSSRTFTHLFTMIYRYDNILKALNTGEDAQRVMLNTIFTVWKTHQQLMVVLIDKLIKNKVLTGTSVVNWLFSNEMKDEFTKFYVWEILHATLRRQIKSVQTAKIELEKMREKYNQQQNERDGDRLENESYKSDCEMTDITEEMIEKLEEKMELSSSDQKNLFLIIFHHFLMLLTEHIQRCESQNQSFRDHWFRWCIGRLQQIFFEYHQHVFVYVSTLESLLFTTDLDPNILLLFRQFRSLRS